MAQEKDSIQPLESATELRVRLQLLQQMAARAVSEFLAVYAEADRISDAYLDNEAKEDVDDLAPDQRALFDATAAAADFANNTADLLNDATIVK